MAEASTAAAATPATTTTATTAATATPAAAATTAATPWHTGLDAEVIGLAQNKGWDLTDPAKAFAAATGAYGNAQKMLGHPADKVLRMPEPTADAATLDAFWQRLGAVKDAKEIDFSAIKGADGKPLNDKLAEVMRSTAVATRAPKDVVLAMAQAIQKYDDDAAAAAMTIRTGQISTDQEALTKSWGANKDRNMFVANQALEKLGQAAQIPADRIKAAWDAISKVGGVGAVDALNMLYAAGRTMGEDRFVNNGGPGGANLPMTRESAQAEITALKGDPVFSKRYTEGGVEERKRMDALHKIAFGQQAA